MLIKRLNLNLFLIFSLSVHVLCAISAKLLSSWIPLEEFCLFIFSFAVLLVTTVSIKNNYVLKFFNIFMYLGFYLKFCFHTVFSYPFSEPIGGFSGSTSELIEFFQVSSLAAISVSLTSYIIFKFFQASEINKNLAEVISFKYADRYRYFFWFILISCVLVSILNLKLGIILSGVATVTVLPSPLNAIIGFFLYSGFSILIAINGLFEFKSSKKLNYTAILVILEGTISSVSLISRGIFLFHFLPYLVCLIIFRKELFIKFKYLILIVIGGAVFFVVSGFFVTTARSVLYNNYNLNHSDYMSKNLFDFFGSHQASNEFAAESEEEKNAEIKEESVESYKSNRDVIFGSNHTKKSRYNNCSNQLCVQFFTFATQISGLVIDRWIGTEGLMAVVSYSEKDIELIYSSLVRIPKVGEKDIFEKMNRSFYPISTKYVFTSLPGPVAFFYYSGMPVVVFFGMMFFVFILFSLQKISSLIINNVFVQFQTAFLFAINFMQFGISPKPLLSSFIMIFSFLIFIRLIMIFIEKKARTQMVNV